MESEFTYIIEKDMCSVCQNFWSIGVWFSSWAYQTECFWSSYMQVSQIKIINMVTFSLAIFTLEQVRIWGYLPEEIEKLLSIPESYVELDVIK